MKTQENGKLGETLARDFLEHEGFRFVAANFLRRVGEIDIIMLSPNSDQGEEIIVFVEVRYRATAGFGGALASIDRKKQRKLLRAASAWLQKNACSTQRARIDVITVEPQAVDIHANEINTTAGTEQACNYLWKKHRLVWVQNAIEELT